MDAPVVSVVLPTHGRAGYLGVALGSLAAQDLQEPWELLVVDDGSSDGTAELLAERGTPTLRFDPPRGLNAARNAGVRATSGELIAFTDDDVRVPPGWLRALVEGARRHPGADAFGGPIRARLEGPAPRACGRGGPPPPVGGGPPRPPGRGRPRRSRCSTSARATGPPSSPGARTWRCAAARSG